MKKIEKCLKQMAQLIMELNNKYEDNLKIGYPHIF